MLLLGLGACKKDYGPNSIGPIQDSPAEIPVTVTNQDVYERYPIIIVRGAPATAAAALTGDIPFVITFQIPAGSGTIKEITRVQTGNTGLNLLQNGTVAQAYNFNGTTGLTPTVGNGTNTITFRTSLADYRAYRTRVGAVIAGNAAVVDTGTNTPQAPNFLRYFFVLTLADNTQIIPVEVRIRLL